MQYGMMDYGMGFGYMGFFVLIFWILLIVGLVLLIKYLWQGGSVKNEESALEVLKKRYARGEISKEEFEEKKKDLL